MVMKVMTVMTGMTGMTVMMVNGDVLMFCCFAVPALVLLSCLRQILVLLLRPTHTTFENIEDGDDEDGEDVGGGRM